MEEYSVTIKVKDPFLIGPLIGRNGEFRKQVEHESGALMTISHASRSIVLSSGGIRSKVRAAEKLVIERLGQCYYECLLTKGQAGILRGQGLTTLKQLQSQCPKTGIYLKDEGDNVKLTIMSYPTRVKFAKEKVFEKLSELIEQEVCSVKINMKRKFAETALCPGKYEALYVDGQLPPNPSRFFMKFYPEKKSKRFVPYATEESELMTPKEVYVGCPILAPFKGYFYRAEIRELMSGLKQTLLLRVLFVDYGNEEVVHFTTCKDIDAQYLYPGEAQPCTLPELIGEFSSKTIAFFRNILSSSPNSIQGTSKFLLLC